jgi:hypothetical protein
VEEREQILDALDQFRDVRGTVALFDGIATGDAAAIARALKDAPEHPLAGRVGAWMRAQGVAPPSPPTTDELLARLGIGDVGRWVQDQDRALARLEQRLRDVEQARLRSERAASGLAAVCVVLAAAAALGWLAAYGILDFGTGAEARVEAVGAPAPRPK